MTTFAGIVAFEVRFYLRRISTWVYFGAFFGLAFMLMCAYGGAWEGVDLGSSRALANSPARIVLMIAVLGMLLAPVTAAVVGNAVYRDFESGIHPLFFTAGVRKRTYLAGRYAGGLVVNLVLALGIPLGIAAASLMPFMAHDRIGPFRPAAYLEGIALFIVPNLLFTGAVFFGLAALTRKILPNYAGGIFMLLGYGVSVRLANDLDNETLAGLVDVFGFGTLSQGMRYWTRWEQNNLLVPVTPLFVWNRLLWLGLGGVFLLFVFRRFAFAHPGGERARRGSDASASPEAGPAHAAPRTLSLPAAVTSRSAGTRLRQYGTLSWRAFRDVVGNVYFPVIVGACLTFLAIGAAKIGEAWGTDTYPVTYQVLDTVTTTLSLFLLVIITFYAGELVWAERELRVSGLTDALPLPGWLPYAAKLTALGGMLVLMLAVGMVAGIGIQLAHGYHRFEIGQYLTELFVIQLVPYLQLAVLALLVHVLANHKYVGHFLLIVYYVLVPFFAKYISGHHLAQYSDAPSLVYSDLNGYGHALVAWGWFMLFWSAVAALLALATSLLWVRGREDELEPRLKMMGPRLGRRGRTAAGALAVLAAGTGGWILYNTNYLNDFHTESESTQLRVDYERNYKRFEARPQPRITAVRLAVDLFPESREMRVRGTYRLLNRTRSRIDSVFVDLPSSLTVHAFTFDRPFERVLGDKENGFYGFRLGRPLLPGDSAELRFDVAQETHGFTNDVVNGPVVGNGTFFNNQEMPRIGYNADGELQDDDTRKWHDLPPRARIPRLDDPAGRMRNDISADADWIAFETTVSTSADQTAVAPGYLQRTWTAGGRRYFRYRMDAPILDFYAYLSGRYAVRRDRWHDVAIEVYYDPGHEFNLDRMVRSVKRSLDYYTEHFGPYQNSQVRILEFPRYAAYAQSYANTIPYSEAIGFIAHVKPGDVDYPFFVTAHEVAHQWWGHQLVGAHVQGSAMLSETLAEYSALMVMEKEYGREKMEDFLRYELDQYLRGRGSETRAEQPLYRVEQQGYIHYNKGGMAMYALRDYIGEDRVNAALAALLREQRFRGPPYATSRDLLRHLRAVTPDSLRYVLTDLFQTVTLYENRTRAATATPLGGGRWMVDMTVEAHKMRADSAGNETEVPMNDLVDVSVVGSAAGMENFPLYFEKQRLRSGVQHLRVTVGGVPARAGIDPRHKLIARRTADNVVNVVRKKAPAPPKAARPAPAKPARPSAPRP